MSEQLIPNAVGRLDDVVEAIRRGDIDKACTLLEAEGDRRHAKLESIKAELEKERDALIDVESFRFELGAATIDRIEKIRMACRNGAKSAEDGIAPVGAFTILRHSQKGHDDHGK